MSITVSEDARRMRKARGKHTLSPSEYAALVTQGTTPRRAASEPPDGYALALDKQERTRTTPASALDAQRRMAALVSTPPTASNAPDGYAIAIEKQRRMSTTPVPAPTSHEPPDGYAIALDAQRNGK